MAKPAFIWSWGNGFPHGGVTCALRVRVPYQPALIPAIGLVSSLRAACATPAEAAVDQDPW